MTDGNGKASAYAKAARGALTAAITGVAGYLADWRNLLGHAALGAALLAAAIWVPVPPPFKLAAIAALIAFNIWRSRLARPKSQKGAKASAGPALDSGRETTEEPA